MTGLEGEDEKLDLDAMKLRSLCRGSKEVKCLEQHLGKIILAAVVYMDWRLVGDIHTITEPDSALCFSGNCTDISEENWATVSKQ